MQSNYKINCLVLGDDPIRNNLPIKIACSDTVGDLKKLIKEENKHAFHDIDARYLELWNVENLLVDNAFKDTLKLRLEEKGPLSAMDQMDDVFVKEPQPRRLHIVVDRPPAADHQFITLNCLISGGDPNNIFEIKIASTATVSALKDVIKEKNDYIFRNVDARALQLWQVTLPFDDVLKRSLQHVLDLDQMPLLSPLDNMIEAFKPPPMPKHVHVIIGPPPASQRLQRLAYLEMKSIGPPSSGAQPAAFRKAQEQKKYLCNRPREAADHVPVILLERVFADFVDDFQTLQPSAHDNNFARELSEHMCPFYANEDVRMDVFRDVFRKYGIVLENSTIGPTKCRTDGHLLSSCGNFIQVITEGKNEIGSGSAEPFAEALLYYRKFLKESGNEFTQLQSIFPCFHILVFGPCVGIAGAVFPHKIQSDVLAPIIPLSWHSTDLPMQAMAARILGALKIAIRKLENIYSKPIPPLEPDGELLLGCPYPRSYTDSLNRIHGFSYHKAQPSSLRNRLIFFGKTVDGKQICLKFVRHYSPDVHQFIADKGHAPELIAYNALPGGWNMVVMDVLDIHDGTLPRRQGSYRHLSAVTVLDRQTLKGPITLLVKALHKHGYVHGDLRDTNFFLRNDGDFMLLDFDWAGRIEKTLYPMYVNRQDIRRPEDVEDGKVITVEHDLEMLREIFEQHGPAAKRRRVSFSSNSTGEDSPVKDL